jgi:hypothetical protein
MYSTRKAPKRLGVAYNSRAAAAAAGVAEAAEVAEHEHAAAVDAAAVDTTTVEAAVCRGVLAASVEPDRLRLCWQTRIILAGLDKVDPAKPYVLGNIARVSAWAGLCVMAEWVSSLVEKCQRASWTRKIQWPKNAPCTGEPGWRAR